MDRKEFWCRQDSRGGTWRVLSNVGRWHQTLRKIKWLGGEAGEQTRFHLQLQHDKEALQTFQANLYWTRVLRKTGPDSGTEMVGQKQTSKSTVVSSFWEGTCSAHFIVYIPGLRSVAEVNEIQSSFHGIFVQAVVVRFNIYYQSRTPYFSTSTVLEIEGLWFVPPSVGSPRWCKTQAEFGSESTIKLNMGSSTLKRSNPKQQEKGKLLLPNSRIISTVWWGLYSTAKSLTEDLEMGREESEDLVQKKPQTRRKPNGGQSRKYNNKQSCEGAETSMFNGPGPQMA